MVEIVGLTEIANRLRALPPALGSKGGGPLRYALFQAAKVVLAQAKLNLIKNPSVRTGELLRNIVTKRHRNPKAVGATERYDIGMRGGTRKYANNRFNRSKRRAGSSYKTEGAVWYGRLVETGTSRMKAEPFLRPAIDSKWRAAVDVFRDAFLRAVEKAEAKLARMN